MRASLKEKLDKLELRFAELGEMLCDPELVNEQKKFQMTTREHAQLSPIVDLYQQHKATEEAIEEAKQLQQAEKDVDMRALAEEEVKELTAALEKVMQALEVALIPKDPDDHKDVFVEIRAGTGGDEAAIFSGDLLRMYTRYGEQRGWKVSPVNLNSGDHGGYKEAILRVSGEDVYSQLKFESGAHRVQRVPQTESQGRVHTSACTVAVLPVVEDIDEVEFDANDLRIDTFRASGAGGQHVNKTDSAIRITHIPTGVVVECQDDRSQHKNKARALGLLKSKLLSAEREKQQAEQAQARKSLVGSGDRSERIRTYNFPQGRLTDHRIGLTLYKLDEIIQEGKLDQVIEPLIREHQAEQMASMQ